MDWPSTKIASWEQLTNIIDELSGFAFRGQADATWSLASSLSRLLPSDVPLSTVIDIEKTLLKFFESQASLYFDPRIMRDTDHLLRWWSLMQHHYAPTRLLDWSDSAYVGLYFAVNEHWDQDGALYAFDQKQLLDKTPDWFKSNDEQVKFLDCNPSELVCWLFARGKLTERMAAQQGLFTVTNKPLTNQCDAIIDILGNDPGVVRKILIPKEQKKRFFARLRSMNITAVSLFPGGDGLGRSCQELARLGVNFDVTSTKAFEIPLERNSLSQR